MFSSKELHSTTPSDDLGACNSSFPGHFYTFDYRQGTLLYANQILSREALDSLNEVFALDVVAELS